MNGLKAKEWHNPIYILMRWLLLEENIVDRILNGPQDSHWLWAGVHNLCNPLPLSVRGAWEWWQVIYIVYKILS